MSEKVDAHTADDLKKWLDHECTGLGFMIAGSDHVIREHQVKELETKLRKLEALLERMMSHYTSEDKKRDIRVMRQQAATLRAFVQLVLAPVADLTWTSTVHLDKQVPPPEASADATDLTPVEGRMREGGGWKGGAQYHRGGHAHGDGHVHHAGSMKHGTMHTDGMRGTQMRDSHGKFK